MKNNPLYIVGGLVVIGVVGYFLMQSMSGGNTNTTNPSQTTRPQQQMADSSDSEEGNTIVDIAMANNSFSTLVAAVVAADLVDTLSSEGPFTVFAPTDEAFAALPEGTLEALLEDTEALTEILTYHVVPGKVMASDVVQLNSSMTALGQEVSISTEGGDVMVNDATVVQADIEASNGVIHVIDKVLLP